jgi:molybdopterin/thiamine biosynthesis adenylyltransferase
MSSMPPVPRKSVSVFGLGNTGSPFVGHLAWMPSIEVVNLIDGDVYEHKNLYSQQISPDDVGLAKAEVQATRLRQLNPTLAVHAYVAWAQDVPRGLLAADLFVSCLDSRVARQFVNEVAWRLSIPWVDVAVDAEATLVRVNTYVPASGGACMECAWSDDDYAALEHVYPCQQGGVAVPATNAPSALGAVAAGLAAIEAQALLIGKPTPPDGPRQILLDVGQHRCLVTAYRRNAHCRFDHEAWTVERLPGWPGGLSLRQLVQYACAGGDVRRASVRLPGHGFVRQLVCPRCGGPGQACLHLERRVINDTHRCVTCGAGLTPSPFHTIDWLPLASLGSSELRSSLSSLGFHVGDIVAVRTESGERRFVLQHQGAKACKSSGPHALSGSSATGSSTEGGTARDGSHS